MSIEHRLNVLRWLNVAVAPISLFASTLLLICIYRHQDDRRNTVFHRLMVGVAVHDWLGSFAFSLGPIPIPKKYDIPYAMGTQATCTLQGMLVNMMVTSSLYSASVPIYFLFIIRYKCSEHWIAQFVEPVMHLVALSWGYVTTITGLIIGVFNPAATQNICSIAVAPPGCDYSIDIECTRGQNAEKFAYASSIVPYLTVAGLLIVSLTVVIYTIRSQLRRNMLYKFHHDNRNPTTALSGAVHSIGSFHGTTVTATTTTAAAAAAAAAAVDQSHPMHESTSPAPTPVVVDSTSLHPVIHTTTTTTRAPTPMKWSFFLKRPREPTNNNNNNRCEAMLHQAITQCLTYGFAYLFCLVWTATIIIISLSGQGSKLLTQYYWVSTPDGISTYRHEESHVEIT
jgi:hypothetical protein